MASLPHPGTIRRPSRGGAVGEPRFALFLARELAIWAGLYAVYLLVRGQTIAGVGEALANAHRVVEVERVAGLDQERVVQEATRAAGFLDELFARYYELGFFPVVIAGLLLLAWRDRDRYRELRTAMLLAIGVATVVFALLPTAPPRLVAGLGIADTVGMNEHDAGSLYGVPYNPYAAMPSMHVGWTLLLAIGLFGVVHGAWRLVVALHPALMAVAVIATGNHYVLDAAVGATIALLALATVRWQRARSDRVAPAIGGGAGRFDPCGAAS